jgi:hypothetical protein
MARYNSALASATITGATTISTPNQGTFTAFVGTAPYTVVLPSPGLFPGTNQTFYNATSGTITLSTPAGIFTGTGGSGLTTTSVFTGNVVSVTSDGTNYVVISEDGSILTATTGSFSGDVTINGGSATVSITAGTVNIAPTLSSNINNIAIGSSTRASGAFTTLTANNAVTFTANTSSSSTSTGSLVVTGGIGATGNINSGGNVSATNLTGTLQTAAQTNITSVGTLTGLTVNGVASLNGRTTVKDTINADTSYPLGVQNGSQQIWWLRAQTTSNKFSLHLNGTGDLVTVDTGGNVGIGTLSPSGKLHVTGPGNTTGGNIHMGNNTDAAAKWSYLTGAHYNGATNPTGISLIGGYSDSSRNAVVIGGSIYEANPATEIQFWTHTATTHNLGGTQRMFINTNGNVGINNGDPQYRLHVGGTTFATGITISTGGGTNVANTMNIDTDGAGTARYYSHGANASTAGAHQFRLASSNGAVDNVGMTLSNTGNLSISGTLTESSSIALKENVEPITGALNLVNKLMGKIYDRRDNGTKQESGLIAEEVFVTAPNLVALDEDGKPVGVKYTKIIAYLIESIKELSDEVTKLKGK